MSGSLNRIIASGALFLTLATGASAQTLSHDDTDHDAPGIICGMELTNNEHRDEALANTARTNPELYRQIIASTKMPNRRAIASVGDEHTFYSLDYATNQYFEVTATLVYDGILARIWVDNADTARVKPTVISQLARGLDSVSGTKSRNPAKGIIENDKEVYGDTPKKWEIDGKTDFLMTDIQDGQTGGSFVAGYFSPFDQTGSSGSNMMNLLFIDSRQGLSAGVNALLSTIAHEFQHLIHYGKNPSSDIVFNEGCSEVASILCGFKDRANTTYLSNTNVSMFKWNYNDGSKVLADYERAMTFMHYLKEQYGEQFLTKFLVTRSSGMQRVTDALKAIGKTATWQDALKSFAAANYLVKSYNDSRYIYQYLLSSSIAKAATIYDSAFAANGSVSVQAYAASYVNYKNPGGMKIRFKSSQNYSVMAMMYEGTTPSNVVELSDNTDYTFNDDGRYDRIVFAVVNLSSGVNSVSWTAEHVALGVEDNEGAVAATAKLAVTAIAPTPSVGQTTISFNTVSSAPVTMQLFGVNGELVSTLVDGERYEPGTHQVMVDAGTLSNGAYVVRLVQGTTSESRVMLVMK